MEQKPLKHIVILRHTPSTIMWGGLEKLLLEWFDRVDYSQCKVILGINEGWTKLFQDRLIERKIQVQIVEFPFMIGHGPRLKRFFRMYSYLNKLKPDTVVYMEGRFLCFGFPDVLAGFLTSRGNVYMHENLEPFKQLPKLCHRYVGVMPSINLWWYMQRWGVRARELCSKKILVVSNEIKDKLVSIWNYSKDKIVVRYHGVDTSAFSPSEVDRVSMRHKLSIFPSEKVILVTARLSKEKRIERVIEAMEELCEQMPDIKLLIAGSGPLQNELIERAQSKKCRNHIIFLGHVEDVKKLLNASDIHVTSSDVEGFGISLVEAMSCGLICISTRCTGPSEIIKDGINGFLVETSYQGILDGLKKALSLSIQEQQRMQQAAMQYSRDMFNINDRVKEAFLVMDIPFKATGVKAC